MCHRNLPTNCGELHKQSYPTDHRTGHGGTAASTIYDPTFCTGVRRGRGWVRGRGRRQRGETVTGKKEFEETQLREVWGGGGEEGMEMDLHKSRERLKVDM